MRMPDFYSCHPKQALAGVGQPGGRAGVVTPRGGSNPAPGLTLPTLKQGVVGAFVVTRSWALITPPSTCSALPLNCGAPLGYFSWEMIAQGAFAAVETASGSSA